jgi:hypothetical protein
VSGGYTPALTVGAEPAAQKQVLTLSSFKKRREQVTVHILSQPPSQ